MGNIFVELRRRNVFRFAGMYAVVAWLIIQVAGEFEEALGLPDWFDGLTVSLLLLCFPIALVLAWFFDITPDGIRRSTPAKGAPRPVSRIDVAILAGLVIVAGIVVADRFLPDAAAPAPEAQSRVPDVQVATEAGNSNFVAVLPFRNQSADTDNAYFADGVHDSLLTQLSKIRALKVISRTSVQQYRDTRMRLSDVAAELGVAVVLEGAVQRVGNQVLINVRLVDGISDIQLWGADYQRELTTENLFAIQSEITHAIAMSLEALLTGPDQATLDRLPTQDMRAYESYVRGKILVAWGSGLQGHLDGIAAFEDAIRLDPDFAAARALRAGYLMSLYRYFGYGDDYRDEAAAELERAAALAPDSVEILIEQAFFEQRIVQDFQAAIDLFQRVLAKAPNHGEAWAGLAETWRSEGDLDETISAFEKAMELDPRNPGHVGQLLETLVFFGRFDDARRMLQRAEELSPGAAQNVFSAALIEWFAGDCAAALEVLAPGKSGGMPYENVMRVDASLACGSRAEIAESLAVWPEAERRPDALGILYDLYEAKVLRSLGDDVAATRNLLDIRERLDAQPIRLGWSPVAAYDPSTVPALLGDAPAVRAAAAEYEQLGWKSVWDRRFLDASLVASFTLIGDARRASDYLARLVDNFGPAQCLPFAGNREFSALVEYEPVRALYARYPACLERAAAISVPGP